MALNERPPSESCTAAETTSPWNLDRGSLLRSTLRIHQAALSCVDGSLFASPILRLIHCQMQSCVRPVGAAHLTAGPPSQRCLHRLPGSGWFPQTKSHSAYRTASVQDKARGVLVLGLTIFPSLHWSCKLVFLVSGVR